MAKAEIEKVTESAPTTGIMTAGDFASLVKDKKFKITRDFQFQEPGTCLHAFFVSAGAPIEVDSQSRPGTKDIINTWRLRDPNGLVIWNVMGSMGLDKYLAPLAPDTEVAIQYIGKKEIKGGKRINDFVVAVL